jgi:hypothetical protein
MDKLLIPTQHMVEGIWENSLISFPKTCEAKPPGNFTNRKEMLPQWDINE